MKIRVATDKYEYMGLNKGIEVDAVVGIDFKEYFFTLNGKPWVLGSGEIEIPEEQEIKYNKKYRVVKVERNWKYYDPILEEYLYMEGFVYDNSDEDPGIVEILFDDGNTWSFKPEWLVPVEEEEKKQPSQDNVNFPSHYQLINDIEVKDVVKVILSRWQSSGQEMSFNQAGMMKELLQYLLRAPLKNKKEDVLKAQWYLNELVKEWEEK